jgi:hypothetical protein
MAPKNLPTIDARYWTAILAASMCGANTGDFASRILGLGHTRGLLPLALIFLAVIWAERRMKVTTEAYYWLAIIVLRTGATNLADLGTHDLKLGYFLCMGLLVALMVVMLLIDRARGFQPVGIAGPDGRWHSLPITNGSYWITMLAAGTLGTAAGDATGPGLRVIGSRRHFPRDVVCLQPLRRDDKAVVLADHRGGANGWHNARRFAGEPPWPGTGFGRQHDLHQPSPRRNTDPLAAAKCGAVARLTHFG